MRDAETIFAVLRERGTRGLPLEDLYRQLFNRELYLRAYDRLSRRHGAMTPGSNPETVDGMSLARIDTIIEAVRFERYRWTPVRRTYIEKKHSTKKRPLGIPTISTYSGVAPALFRFAGGHASIPPVEGPAVEHSVRAQASRWPAVRVCGRSPGHDRLASGLDQPG